MFAFTYEFFQYLCKIYVSINVSLCSIIVVLRRWSIMRTINIGKIPNMPQKMGLSLCKTYNTFVPGCLVFMIVCGYVKRSTSLGMIDKTVLH